MPEYNNYPNGTGGQGYQRDLTLAPNEYVFVQSRTNGVIKTYTGPYTITISGQESLVVFDPRSKQFKETNDFEGAKQTFVSAPEGWYVSLKNPAPNNTHPGAGGGVDSPKLEIGKKINISGPVSFSLFPGQMARVIRGHRLRSNQYLLARVYDADVASKSNATIISADGEETVDNNKYYAGQILVIKGTEVAFYVPPTGIEVIPVDNDTSKGYVREAITLERLEYCILKDENGSKTYCHGPAVVFPKPTETFVASRSNSYIFRAIELSKISGIYVKVIAEYDDEQGVHHPIGEEMFITGDNQMIYYPRPEHAIINYDEKILHHAIAIPEGEGRYIMNRLTGEINTIKGPDMYLPDPRTEVVVKRKLTPSQCELWFPGNQEALNYNLDLTEKAVEKSLKSMDLDSITAYCCSSNTATTLANLEAKANISRGTSYTKPRTITLDNKFEGVVSIDIWTGYAVDVVSKDGSRKVICGPQTVLLDYDQTLEVLQMSCGTPKSTDRLLSTVFLRHENNKVSDLIEIETKDFVRATIKVSYCVDFDPAYNDKWFNVENYVKYMCDRQRSIMKREAKKYTIEEFYQNYSTIIRNIAIDEIDSKITSEDKHKGRFFPENGMYVHDCEVLSLQVESSIAKILSAHQTEMITKTLELSSAAARVQVAEALADAEKKENEVKSQQLINKMELQREEAMRKAEISAEMARKKEAEERAQAEATNSLQNLIDTAHKAKLAREKAEHDAEIEHQNRLAEIETGKQAAYAATVKEIISAIGPDLVAALSTKSNNDMLAAVTQAMAPYAIAKGESIAEVTNKLLRGTSLENIIEDVNLNV